MLQTGKVVEYIEQGKFICAAVLGESGKRLKLLNQNGRELNLPVARVIHCTEAFLPSSLGRDDTIRELKERDLSRQEFLPKIQLEDIWQLAMEEEGAAFTPRFLAELSFGETADDDHVAAFLRSIFSDRLFFKYKEGKILAHSAEVVEQLRVKQEKERLVEELLTHGAQALRQFWEGHLSQPWAEQEHCLAMIRDYYLFANDAEEAATTKELLKRAGLNRPHDPLRLLKKAGVWQPDENIPLLRYELPSQFAEDVLADVSVAEPDAQELLAQKRRDLRSLPLLTLDGSATRDYDDALHIEKKDGNFLVGIHISDVANYVKPGHPLYDEAARRMTSIYFADGVVPMLPPELSEGVCSLIANKVRAAMSFLVLLSPRGEVLEFEVVPSVVTVKRQLSYEESEAHVMDDPELRDLSRLAEQLRQRRIENGALVLPVPDVVVDIDDEGEVSLSLSPVDTKTRSLVAEYMVLANTLAGEFIADRQEPGLFRAQGEPYQRIVRGIEKEIYPIWRQRKQLKRGELLTRPKAHSGVGVPQYTTITSPIRRYLDLVMQHQVHNLLKGRGPLFNEDTLTAMAATINTTLSKVNQVRFLRHRYWLLKYFSAKVGQRVEAIIINKGPKRVNLVLLECLLDIDLPPSQGVKARPGDTVRVKVARVDVLDNILRIEW